MSHTQLPFSREAVASSAQKVLDDIRQDRIKEAQKDWKSEYHRSFWQWLRNQPVYIPPIDPAYLEQHIESNFWRGSQKQVAEDMVAYCQHQDCPDQVNLSREDARRLWLLTVPQSHQKPCES